jgi:hypothetical protein
MALLILLLYTLFTTPLTMQDVTFEDPHAFLFYWNRYYFAIVMLIHLFGVALLVASLAHALKHFNAPYPNASLTLVPLLLFGSTINPKLHQIVTTEAHLINSQKLYQWVSNKVGKQPLTLLSPSSMIYQQNLRPDGKESIAYLIGRGLTLHAMPVTYQSLTPQIRTYYPIKRLTSRYLLCVDQAPCRLSSQHLKKVGAFKLPITWREHLSLDPTQHPRIENSRIQKRTLYASLYQKRLPSK